MKPMLVVTLMLIAAANAPAADLGCIDDNYDAMPRTRQTDAMPARNPGVVTFGDSEAGSVRTGESFPALGRNW